MATDGSVLLHVQGKTQCSQKGTACFLPCSQARRTGINQSHVNQMSCTPHSVRTVCWTLSAGQCDGQTQLCSPEPCFSFAAGGWHASAPEQLQCWQCTVLEDGTELKLGSRSPMALPSYQPKQSTASLHHQQGCLINIFMHSIMVLSPFIIEGTGF